MADEAKKPWTSPESYEERLRASITAYLKYGRVRDAERVQAKLDRYLNPDAAPPLATKPEAAPDDPKPQAPSAYAQAQSAWLAEAAKAHREGKPKPPLPEVVGV